MLLVRKMNVEEREEGEITEYEDISSDEEILLRQRIAEIEATNLELERLSTLTDKIDEKENTNGRTKKGTTTATTKTEVVALTNVYSRELRPRRRNDQPLNYELPRNNNIKTKPKPKPATPARKRRRSKRLRRHSCQLIVSDDEFDSYDRLPLGTENLSPDPLPIGDDDGDNDDDVVVLPVAMPGVIEIKDDDEEEEDDDDDLELKLRLEALRSKQEIKNDLRVILDQTENKKAAELPVVAPPPPPLMDEEQELRLIALKSAIVKKHLVRKKRKEEARPYSPTDDALENFDVPSPPLSVQNMDISPLGTPSPLSEAENTNAVDMDIANEESQSPIFFSCTINTEPADPTALSRMEIQIDPGTMVADSGYDDEDPDKLRAFLLQKIGEAAKRKEMRVESDSLTESQLAVDSSATAIAIKSDISVVIPAQRVTEHRSSESASTRPVLMADDDEDEHVLRANLLSKAKTFKRAKSEEAVAKAAAITKPLSEILSEQSKKQLELKTICRTIENDVGRADNGPLRIDAINITTTASSSNTPVPSPKPAKGTPTRSALINQMPSNRVTPVIISLGASSDRDSTSEWTEDDEDDEEYGAVDLADNASPLSIAMDSPQYASSPVATGAAAPENFDAKLAEYLKKVRQSSGEATTVGEVEKTSRKKTVVGVKVPPMKRIVTNRMVVKKVVAIAKDNGLASAAVRHLPPSTQLEYNRLINRMHQLERQKLAKSNSSCAVPKKAIMSSETTATAIRTIRLSPVKAPNKPSVFENGINTNVTVMRKVVDGNSRSPITVLVHNNNNSKSNNPAKIASVTTTAATKSTVPSSVVTAKVPLEGEAATTTEKQSPTSGRRTLKDRLKLLTNEQMKMLLDVQQRKVVTKRKSLNQSLDTFLGTMTETMVANRQQIRTELEVRRLKRMLKLKEQQLADQRQLCSGTLHERLQGQYKAVVVARQSLATVTAQCREIGAVEVKDKEAGDGEEQGFRLTEEGSEGLGAKFRKYKEEIETYRELRGKIKRGVFTIADLKDPQEEKVEEEKKELVAGPAVSEKEEPHQEVQTAAVQDENVAGPVVAAIIEKPEQSDESKSKEPLEVMKEKQNAEESNSKPEISFPVYKSPLEHMEYLDTADSNGILCPFQLNGTCQDARCSYRHLAS